MEDPDFPNRDAEWFEPEEQPADNSGAVFWLVICTAVSVLAWAFWQIG